MVTLPLVFLCIAEISDDGTLSRKKEKWYLPPDSHPPNKLASRSASRMRRSLHNDSHGDTMFSFSAHSGGVDGCIRHRFILRDQ